MNGLENLTIGSLEAQTSLVGTDQYGLTESIIDVINNHCLDIFLAPEWLFLPKDRLYTRQEKDEIIEKIARETSRKNTLILPGTIMWNEGTYVYNSAPIITEGKIMREYFKRNEGGDEEIARRHNLNYQTGRENGVAFKWRGFDVGLEICADLGLISYNQNIRPLDFQIVLACGMELFDRNLKLKDMSYGILCDGNVPLTKIKQKRSSERYEERIIPDAVHEISPLAKLKIYNMLMHKS